MDVFRIQIVDPRALQILRALEERGWIVIEPIDEGEETFEDADLFMNEKRMTDEEFESFAAEILAR
jgi:streptomycin 6-kinase